MHDAHASAPFASKPAPRRGPPLALGIVGIVLGVLVGGVGLLILIWPLLLFLIGGGGDVAGWEEFAAPIFRTGFIVVGVAAVLLVGGIVLTVLAVRARRARRRAGGVAR